MTSAAELDVTPLQPGGVQSISRVFSLLESMAEIGGIASVSELAERSGLPLPTIHRLLRTLVALGYARQEPSREYALGPRLVRLGDAANRLVEAWAKPHLSRLAETLGETANLALLDGSQVVYVAQAPGRHSMRMFTEVGHRAGLHCTAVGKAILATLEPDKAARLFERTPLQAYTHRTITTVPALMREVAAVAARGYATDLCEQENGVSCVAVALPGAPARGAVSISGPLTRMTDDLIQQAVPTLRNTARDLARELALASR
jgi:IclR family acetate operon transcriptional repressor